MNVMYLFLDFWVKDDLDIFEWHSPLLKPSHIFSIDQT